MSGSDQFCHRPSRCYHKCSITSTPLMNKPYLVTAAFGLVLLAACKPISNSPESAAQPAPGTQAPPAAEITAQPERKSRKATPERIAEIVASGQKGFWASVTEVCPKERPIPTTMLTWNVTDSGAKFVVLHIIDPKKNTDRPFAGRHGPVGERETGHWLRPGLIFKLRSMDDGKELGSVTIGEKAC